MGVEPLQQYLVELPGGRLQALDIAWDTVAGRWYHLYPDQDATAGNGLHWTGFYKNWQARCAVCHQTDFRKNYKQETHSYQSTWSELTVGCEACHGPGGTHVAWAQKKPQRQWTGLLPNGLLKPQSNSRQSIEQDMCGPCHSRRDPLGADSTLPGDHFSDHYALTPLGGLYFADGQQYQEVYILGSFLQSKMHEKGVTCSNCHDPHSGRTLAEGNAICTQCHNESGRAEFPSLVSKKYDSPQHHHHTEGTPGAQCVNCHMPERKYMTVDGRRDHFFRIPDPELSKLIGSPDACGTCHTDKTAEWGASAIHSWSPDRAPSDHSTALLFSDVLQKGLSSERLSELATLAQDTRKPDVVRASALDDMGDQVDPAMLEPLSRLLTDSSELVRSKAPRLWRSVPGPERVRILMPLLKDPVATVRIAAALEMASIKPDDLPMETRSGLDAALQEMRASMTAKSDFPEGQMAIGGLAVASGNWVAAQEAFAEAVFMDPQLVQVWLTRARIAGALGDNAEAIAILNAAYTQNPASADVGGALAQLLLSQGRLPDAIPVLRDLLEVVPDDLHTRINLAYALLQTGDLQAAGMEIGRLRLSNPQQPEVMILHASHQLALGDLVGSRETVRELKRAYPNLRLPPKLEALATLP
ncbi:MAG: tetratricopeptide repeat protein [Rhizobiaceae bacterium]|nr:tetratricopeptide repeat protein [Rhizobiaceae bacterium]